jgi:toxin ParE1/3/4
MRILFLENSLEDLRWFKRYYTEVFPQGRAKADQQFLATKRLLRENPRIGNPFELVEGAREFPVSRTPFAFLYFVRDENIEVLRIVDNRSDWRKEYAND